eukprot:snap_masked-scaffold_45-processed-gene-0.6-mRNA-1 protein AED:1.00 eAED:1.00 QI:0/-1/0/0/-1/1/1/0/74
MERLRYMVLGHSSCVQVYKYQTNFSFGMKLQGLKKNANVSSLYGLAIKFQEANSIFNSEEKKYALADLVDALEN